MILRSIAALTVVAASVIGITAGSASALTREEARCRAVAHKYEQANRYDALGNHYAAEQIRLHLAGSGCPVG